MNYTSLLLDLDNTLLDFTMAEAHAIRKVLKLNGLPYDGKNLFGYKQIVLGKL